MNRAVYLLFFSLMAAGFTSGCVKEGCTDPAALNYNDEAQRDDGSCTYGDKYANMKREVMELHADLAFAMYTDAHSRSISLFNAVNDFISDPDAPGLQACRTAWSAAYEAYLWTEGLRFSMGPIDDERNLDRLIGAWPINPSLVDQRGANPGGVVYDPTIIEDIDPAGIAALNEVRGPGQITTGFHVIEFLLWGPDTGAVEEVSAGSRRFEEFDINDTTYTGASRRRIYLKSACELLVTHLAVLADEWDKNGIDTYRESFLALTPNEGMQRILTGLATLAKGELAERAIEQPVAANVDAYEISRFSDQSVRNIISMIQGLDFIYHGSYVPDATLPLEGTTLADLTLEINPDLAADVEDEYERLYEATDEMPEPFDLHMKFEGFGNPGPYLAVANRLKKLEDQYFEVAREMDFGLTSELPE